MAKTEIVLPSALFPFRISDLPGFDYGRYRLENVFGRIEPAQQQACVELWLRNTVIPSPKAAWDRSRQVCYLLHEAGSGRLVGLNTLYPDRIEGFDRECLLNRMYIEPAFRDSRLMIVATAATLCFAVTRLADDETPGIVNINENPKLARPGMRRVFSRLGYRDRGRDRGRDVWFFDFSSVTIRETG